MDSSMNMQVTVYKMASFTKNGSGGNIAGVVLNAEQISEKQMQHIATIVGYSETVFLSSVGGNNYTCRYFTPKMEVPFCVHATLGASHLLKIKMHCKDTLGFQTKGGNISVHIDTSLLVKIWQPPPLEYETVKREDMLQFFPGHDLHYQLPSVKIFVALPTLIIPFSGMHVVAGLDSSDKIWSELSKKFRVRIIYCFTQERIYIDSTVHARMFAPEIGICEESATGMAAGALAAYYFREKYLELGQNIVIEQGYKLGSPSEICVEIAGNGNKMTDSIVGGKAQLIMQENMYI